MELSDPAIVRKQGQVLARGLARPASPGHRAARGERKNLGRIVLHHVELFLIYWGSLWADHAVFQKGAAESLVSSPCVTALREYRRTIGPGQLAGSQPFTGIARPGDNFTDHDVAKLLRRMMREHLLSDPVNDQNLFLIVAPPSVTVEGTLGEHWCFTMSTTGRSGTCIADGLRVPIGKAIRARWRMNGSRRLQTRNWIRSGAPVVRVYTVFAKSVMSVTTALSWKTVPLSRSGARARRASASGRNSRA